MDKFWKKKTKDKKKTTQKRGMNVLSQMLQNTGNGEWANEKWEQNLT